MGQMNIDDTKEALTRAANSALEAGDSERLEDIRTIALAFFFVMSEAVAWQAEAERLKGELDRGARDKERTGDWGPN